MDDLIHYSQEIFIVISSLVFSFGLVWLVEQSRRRKYIKYNLRELR